MAGYQWKYPETYPFKPPIDPAALVTAAAQGIGLSSLLQDLNAPMPNFGLKYILQKALEMVQKLKSLSSALISVKEKRDNETYQIIRAGHNKHDATGYGKVGA